MRNFTNHPLVARGFGLVELMVSMAIGLIMLLAVSYFFLGSQQSSKSHDDSSRMQENARNALELMGKAVRQAGYRSVYNIPITGAAITGAGGNTITVRYSSQDGGEKDCAGTTVSSGVLVFAFSVNASNELLCNNGTVDTVVAENVESLQITYGTDADRNGTVESYSSTPADFSQVAVVKLVLTMRGSNPNAATGGDGYLRQTYTASFTVRNQAG